MKILFLSFKCEDICFAMVTNMISKLEESFPLMHVTGSFEISFTKWLRGAKMVQLPVYFSVSCQIFTFTSCKYLSRVSFAQHSKMKFVSPHGHVISSYWTRLCIIWRIMEIKEGGITPSEISTILQMIWKPNSIIVLFFIQNNYSN